MIDVGEVNLKKEREMKIQFASLVVILITLIFSACKTDRNSDVISYSNEEYILSSISSYGDESGDSTNMIGSINGFCLHRNGSILILDRPASRIRIIPPEDNAVLFGRHGEGPGEMLLPQSICSLADGRILVADQMKQEVMAFSENGSYQGAYFNTERYVPYKMCAVDSSSIIGAMLKADMGEDGILMRYTISRYDESDHESVSFACFEWTLPAPELYTDIDLIDFSASRSGNVYIVRDNTEYEIEVYSPNGDYLTTLVSDELNRVAKTQLEIQEETDVFESWAHQDQAYTGGYEPSPYHQLISLAGVDAGGNLWVMKYDVNDVDYVFDVWDSRGSIAYEARYSREDSNNLTFYVDSTGIIAANRNSDRYPEVYRFEGAFLSEAR